jgi:hypothetical protein
MHPLVRAVKLFAVLEQNLITQSFVVAGGRIAPMDLDNLLADEVSLVEGCRVLYLNDQGVRPSG